MTQGSFLRDKGKYHEAISYFDKALEIDPNDPILLSNKGATLIDLKEELEGGI